MDNLRDPNLPNVDKGLLSYLREIKTKINNIISFTATSVVQVVNYQTGAVATGTTIIPFDNTIPQNTEGTQFMSLAITPKSSTNNLKVDVVFNSSYSPAALVCVALFKDSVANALACAYHYDLGGAPDTIVFSYYMTAGTTNTITFRVRAGAQNAGTLTFNGSGGSGYYNGVLISSITVTEVAA